MDKVNSQINTSAKDKKWFTFSNISTALMLCFVVSMTVNPNVKAFVIQNLMKIGLFQPSLPSDSKDAKNVQPIVKENDQDIVFKDSAGKTISLAQLKGKVVFLNFWATWCPPCIAEMPSINKLKKRYGGNDDIVFLMVDADGNYEKSMKFMQKRGYDLPIFTVASAIPENVFSGSLPTTLVLDKQGRLVFKHEGSADYGNEKIVNFIDVLIAK